MERGGNAILYDGATGMQIKTNIFIGPVYVMRLKHMVEDKWNARAEGRKEQKTRQPTGGRGAQGGLRVGEMERDALVSHGVSGFLKESMMERADKAQIRICNGCGTVPIFNAKQGLFVCSLCDGPPKFIGTTINTLEVLPTIERSFATTSIVEMPYATKLLGDELQTYLNMGMRILTAKGVTHLEKEVFTLPEGDLIRQALEKPLPQAAIVDTRVPKYNEAAPPVEDAEEDLFALGHIEKEEVIEAEGLTPGAMTPMYGDSPEGRTPIGAESPMGQTPEGQTPIGAESPMGQTPEGLTPIGAESPIGRTPVYGATTPVYGANSPVYRVNSPFVPNVPPLSLAQNVQPVYVPENHAPFPANMNTTPVYAPATPVYAQSVGGVPQVIQQGGFQEIRRNPYANTSTIVIEGGERLQRQPQRHRQTQPAQPPRTADPSARITIRKIG